jgi:AcrR family transcriptional regulator
VTAADSVPRQRQSSAERRQAVLDAAVCEFGRTGYLATRTVDIARRAGVSQPYLYALFPDKRALFLACHDQATQLIRETLRRAAAEADRDAGQAELSERLGRAATAMFRANPDQLRFQFQARAAAACDPVILTAVRDSFMAVVDESAALHHGAPRQQVLRYMAWAMLYDVAQALNLPDDFRPRI